MSLGQFLSIMRARRMLVLTVTLLVVAAVAGVTALLPKRYQAMASVMVDTRAIAANGAAPSRSEDVMTTQVDVIASPAVALKVVGSLGLEKRAEIGDLVAESRPLQRVSQVVSTLIGEESAQPTQDLKDWIADRLLRNLTVKANRDSQLIRLTYSSPDPEFAAVVANAFVKAYLATVLSLRADPAKEDAKQLDGQIAVLRGELEQAEVRLSKFQQEKGIVATDERLDLETGRLSELSAQLATAESLSYESQARQRQLREFLAGGAKSEPPAEVLTSPVVQQLKQGVAEREAKLGELSRRIGPNHPQYEAASTELSRLRGRLDAEMRAAAQGVLASSGVAQQREGAMRGALEQQRSRVLGLKNHRNTLAKLTREMESAKQAYDAALQRLTQSRLAGDAGQVTGTIVDSAVTPVRPVSPNPTLNLALALAAGLALGVGLALVGETVNGYVRSEREIVEILGVPVLAVLAPKSSRSNVQYLPGPNIYSLPKG